MTTGIEQIVAAEFAKASGLDVFRVTLTDTRIEVQTTGGSLFVMQIGSDDDRFVFEGLGHRVEFPFTEEFFEASQGVPNGMRS